MRFKTRIKETNFIFSEESLARKKPTTKNLLESIVVFEDPNYGSIVEKRIDAGSFLISFMEFDLIKPVNLEMQSDQSLVQMNFYLKGFDLMKHNIREINKGVSVCEMALTTNPFEIMSIFFLKDSFNSLLDYMFWDNKEEFKSFENQIKLLDFETKSFVISPELQTVIREICTCEKELHYKRLYIETKVTELLLLQLEQYQKEEENQNAFSRTDIEKMHEARNLVIKNLTTPCSLIDLAKKVGTNEFKLKKQFKELFGTTVFGYLNEIKMNKAQELLQEGMLNVTQVAEELGYKTSSHFVTAFKRHFGFSPGSVLKVSLTMLLNTFDVLLEIFMEDLTVLSMV